MLEYEELTPLRKEEIEAYRSQVTKTLHNQPAFKEFLKFYFRFLYTYDSKCNEVDKLTKQLATVTRERDILEAENDAENRWRTGD